MQINQMSKKKKKSLPFKMIEIMKKKSAYLIVKLLLFQCQTKVHGVKRSSSAWSLTFSWVHADVSYYFNEFASLLTGCATIVVIQWDYALCYLWGAEEGEEGWRVNLPPDSKWKMSSFSRHGDIHMRDIPFHILFDILHTKKICVWGEPRHWS